MKTILALVMDDDPDFIEALADSAPRGTLYSAMNIEDGVLTNRKSMADIGEAVGLSLYRGEVFREDDNGK